MLDYKDNDEHMRLTCFPALGEMAAGPCFVVEA